MKNSLRRIFGDWKYRNKLMVLLVISSLVPVILLAYYNHTEMKKLTEKNEMESMSFLLEQTMESVDGQISTFSNLMNYLTYSPDIEDVIREKNLDNYAAYEMYTSGADPLLSVPKSYHEAILQIRLFAESIKVAHEYTLLPLAEVEKEWWSNAVSDDFQIQWLVNPDEREIVGVRKIFQGQNLDAILCVTVDYDQILAPFESIITEESCGMVADREGRILFLKNNISRISVTEEMNAEDIRLRLSDDCAAVSCSSGQSEWVYYLFRPQSVFSEAIAQVQMREIPLMILCLILILILGTLFSRLVTRPIEELTENMAEVNAGSRSVTVESDAQDEIGILVRTFRSMMDEINLLIEEQYENRIALKEFELKALQAQINPHFLYNSLSVINWMAIRSNQKEISKITIALSTFYRTALSRGEDMVTVDTCIRNIEAYLEIQLVMHDHDFCVEWKIDEEIKNEKLPKLLLQPVVENAIEHGLAEKEEGEKILKLFVLDLGEEFQIIVEDNGCGMEQEEADKLVTYQAVGYGLKNVNDRIGLLYGKDYPLRIYSQPDKGTRVEMRFPKESRHE